MRESLAGKWSLSTDEERYDGTFDTPEDAIAEGRMCGRDRFWIGQIVEPPQPETMWCAEDWLEHVSLQDDYCGDWAMGWDGSTQAQRSELEDAVRQMMSAWLDKHDLRPRFFNIDPHSVRLIDNPAKHD